MSQFVRVIRRFGKKKEYTEYFDGYVIEKSKETIVIIGVGPERGDLIKEHVFDLSEVSIRPITKEVCESFFRMAILKHENNLNDAEFELIDARRSLNLATERFKTAFKKQYKYEEQK